jgi:hypothetical protein
MSDEMMNSDYSNHGHSGHETEFEREDLGTRGLFVFMIGLAVSGVVIYFIIVGMYSFLDNYERSQMATASPLLSSKGEMSRVYTQAEMDEAFKDNGAPMLETNERGQFRDFLMNQEDQLNSYGWVNKETGVAHIPIERAMDLIVQRGLPVLPQGNADANATPAVRTPAQKSVGKGEGSAK